jgi:ubiquinone/menaquinone biosynthesis C-methylase UbiE
MQDKWIYDEFKQIGVDYSTNEIVSDYDNQHTDFRNYEQEVKDFIDEFKDKNLKELTAIDFGCGTGAFSINASRYFRQIFAIDISNEMLLRAKEKAKIGKITNIEFINSGFLSYSHKTDKVDFIITKYAFHHFSDFWKQIGLINMNKMMKVGGILYIHDVVFQFNPADYKLKINEWIDGYADKLSPDFLEEFEIHIRDEFSTFDWILRGMIERAGFMIDKVKSFDGFSSEYFCVKIKEVATA